METNAKKIKRLQRRNQRERTARKEAERILEDRSLELYHTNQKLTVINAELEEKVAERTRELQNYVTSIERANTEIKQFTYLASHDLKTPLRAIGSLIGFIEEDLLRYTDEYPAFQEIIDLIKSRVNRMHRLLNAILEYANIGKYKKDVEKISIKEVLQEVNSAIILPLGFDIKIHGPLFTLMANRARLFQVFRHIIENGIKYHKKPAEGVIDITAQQTETHHQILIKDNGPGIAPKYHERIFKIFQTLETKDRNKESIGIGLPIVKKIIEEEMDGIVTFQSTLGEGTTFIFSWPKRLVARG